MIQSLKISFQKKNITGGLCVLSVNLQILKDILSTKDIFPFSSEYNQSEDKSNLGNYFTSLVVNIKKRLKV